MMKTILSTLLVSSSLLCLNAVAQEEAVPTFSTNGLGATYVALDFPGAGYEFSPNVEIAVTALGFGGIDLENDPYQLDLYQLKVNGPVATIATAEVTTGNTFYNQTYYQSITPVVLFPGQHYYFEAAAVGNSHWSGFVIGAEPQSGSFSINPDINYLASADDFVNGVPQNALPKQYFFVDENFQFEVVPEPSVLCLGAAGLLGMVWRRRRARSNCQVF